FLPLRVNQAGVIPIIFALSILIFPAQLAAYFQNSSIGFVAEISRGIVAFLDQGGAPYLILYFLLTVGFTYFYTAFTFKPDETAEQLRKNGGFIPGIRPGRPTQDYLARVVSRITIAGALFLGIVAVAPVLAGVLDPSLKGLAIGGTGILIGVPILASGDLLRSVVASGNPLGRSVDASMRAGQLVPDETIVAIFLERLAEADAAKGAILDGFPRTRRQAEALDTALGKQGRSVDV